jgi:cytochrome d ubiquinol oxidase subunit II
MLELATVLVIALALNIYVLTGGADYGGGIWDLLARGPRAQKQRDLIADAIAPIWEANHVWLILVIVALFTAFPSAFALISTALHIPLTLLLIGVVLRGSSFVFRAYGVKTDTERLQWGSVFAISSVITPVWLGVVIGAIASGNVDRSAASAWEGFVAPWLHYFPFAVGLFALTLFAFLAAVYLSVEAKDELLQQDFRKRALLAAGAVAIMALVVLLLSGTGAPQIRARLLGSWWGPLLQIAAAIAALGCFQSLWIGRFRRARRWAVLEVTLIVWGWCVAQYPYLVVPTLTYAEAAAPRVTLRLFMAAIVVGAAGLFPAFFYLFRIFKGPLK